ncbi:MAG: hypothetical protein KAJ51_00050, partial [Thermoplasmata archaeon]|nr:hypothetical protein [Thermoplasmata archaeon]
NVTSAFRGWSVQWQMQFNNIGENVSKAVWINETLPFNMTFQDDNSTQCSIDYSGDGNNITRTIIGWTTNGYEISYKFSNVTVGNHSFVINCTMNDTAILDNYLTNNVTLNWTENQGLIHRDNATIYIPPIDFRKVANVTTVGPNDYVQWTIYFDNYFGSTIDTIWINETLPFNMTYQDDNSTQCSIDYSGDGNNVTRTITGWTANGYEISFKFTNVTNGPHLFVINCTVNSTLSFTILTNNATLECTEEIDPLLTTASVSVIPEYSDLFIPIVIILAIAAIIQRRRYLKNITNKI